MLFQLFLWCLQIKTNSFLCMCLVLIEMWQIKILTCSVILFYHCIQDRQPRKDASSVHLQVAMLSIQLVFFNDAFSNPPSIPSICVSGANFSGGDLPACRGNAPPWVHHRQQLSSETRAAVCQFVTTKTQAVAFDVWGYSGATHGERH